ncbi:TonB-dependent receptor [Pedobacter polaris]|uniref:TonB-dependent receptor n=1 Tax=Pedobacter polaris TaxID=2571273 RepID=A0A4U1CHD8_9SPHI|nr:TonB-dependent receptor [Pedobacter polaris]TKC05360.1 TonB-dependent receptor [Pedobacter polaris]
MQKKKQTSSKGFRLYVLTFSICCAIYLSPGHTLAQIPDTLIKANLLKELIINQVQLSRQNLSPTPIQILSGEDLKRINSLSVADAIRYFSGVQLKDYGGIGGLKTINVRSMGSNHTAVFYNGIQLANAQNGQVDLGKYSLESLEEISLVSGQHSEILQPAKAYASASAIFLKTKIPNFDENIRTSISATLKTGSFGLVNPSFSIQQKISKKLSATASSEYIRANGKYKFRYTNGVYDTIAVRNNGEVDRIRIEAALHGKLHNDGKWNAQVYSFWSDRGLPGAIVANKFDYTQHIWDRSIFAQGSLEQRLSKFTIMFNAKLSYEYTRYLDPEYVTIDGFLDNHFNEKEIFLSAATKFQAHKNLTIGLASDYSYQTLDANIYRFAYPNRSTFLNVFNAALQIERFQIQGNLLSTTLIDRVRQFGSAGDKQIFSPTIMFSYQPMKSSKIRLRGFYKDIFRMPTFNDLYYTFIGNAQLKPEFAKQYDLGLTFANTFKNMAITFVDLQVDAYYNTVKDKIVAQPGANLFRWSMYNLGRVEIRGLELNAKSGFALTNELTLGIGLNYTYQQAIDVTSSEEDNYRGQIPYVPKHSSSFLGKIDYKNWKLNYSFIYTGYRYNQKSNIIYNYMEPWYTHDVTLGYDLNAKKDVCQLSLEVNNLLDQYFDVIPNFPMPGRNYRLTLNYKL